LYVPKLFDFVEAVKNIAELLQALLDKTCRAAEQSERRVAQLHEVNRKEVAAQNDQHD
jgi:hypothetical protein